jgi:hypothetical protein
MSVQPTQRMLFERFVIRAATDEMTSMHGLTGTVNNIYFDPEDNKYRYVLCLDRKQDTPEKTRDVAHFYTHSADGFCTAPCGVVFRREKPAPPESGQCLVCDKASRHTYAFQMEGKCHLLPYCSRACLAVHQERHEDEGRILAEQRAASSILKHEEACLDQDLTDSVIAPGSMNRPSLINNSILKDEETGVARDLTDSVIAQFKWRLRSQHLMCGRKLLEFHV